MADRHKKRLTHCTDVNKSNYSGNWKLVLSVAAYLHIFSSLLLCKFDSMFGLHMQFHEGLCATPAQIRIRNKETVILKVSAKENTQLNCSEGNQNLLVSVLLAYN